MDINRIAYLAQHGSTARIRKKNHKRLMTLIALPEFTALDKAIDNMCYVLSTCLDRAVAAVSRVSERLETLVKNPELADKIIEYCKEDTHD